MDTLCLWKLSFTHTAGYRCRCTSRIIINYMSHCQCHLFTYTGRIIISLGSNTIIVYFKLITHTSNHYRLQTHGLCNKLIHKTIFSGRESINCRRRFYSLLFCCFDSICHRSCRHSGCRGSDVSLAINRDRSYRRFDGSWFIQLNTRATT